jgi:hypothetical protein
MAKYARVQYDCSWCDGSPKKSCGYCDNTGVRTRREIMLLCVGGPFDGEFRNLSALGASVNTYHQFNRASFGGWKRRLRTARRELTAIYVHDSVLKGDIK